MASGPVVGLGILGGGITIAGMPRITSPGIARLSPFVTDPLPKYNPSLNGTTPSPLSGHIFPVQPLPGTGGGSGGGPIGYPIDSG